MSKDESARRNNGNGSNNHLKTINNSAIWPLIGGIAVIGFSVLLLALRAIVPSLIIMLAGIFLIIYWMYIARAKNQKNRSKYDRKCICAICKHSESSVCIKQKCICCSIAKGDKIIGHTNNPLQ